MGIYFTRKAVYGATVDVLPKGIPGGIVCFNVDHWYFVFSESNALELNSSGVPLSHNCITKAEVMKMTGGCLPSVSDTDLAFLQSLPGAKVGHWIVELMFYSGDMSESVTGVIPITD